MFSKLFARMAHIKNILKNPKCRGFDILADEKNLRHFNSPRQQLFSSFGLGDIDLKDIFGNNFNIKCSFLLQNTVTIFLLLIQ